MMTNAILVFSADNTESVRIPFTSVEGTWDATAHTLRIQNRPGTLRSSALALNSRSANRPTAKDRHVSPRPHLPVAIAETYTSA